MASNLSGSIKDKRVAPDLVKERNQCNFDQDEMKTIFFHGLYPKFKEDMDAMVKYPELANSHEFYEMTPGEKIYHKFKQCKKMYEIDPQKYFVEQARPDYNWFYMSEGQVSSQLVSCTIVYLRHSPNHVCDVTANLCSRGPAGLGQNGQEHGHCRLLCAD